MRRRPVPARRAVTVAALCAVLVAGCSSTVDGSGSSRSSAAARSSTHHVVPSGSPAATSTPTSAPASTSASSASSTASGYRTVTVRRDDGSTLVARVYAQDTITDCAAHAYGARMIAFLRAHPCHPTRRVLATTVTGGRTVVLSAVVTGFAGTAADPYVNAATFTRLEKADGTGSINDLLREGHAIPGVAGRIPEREVFQVLGQDDGVTVFDAWYESGTTDDHDRSLTRLEQSLFLSSLTNG